MSQDLLSTETHATDYRGSLLTGTTNPADGDQIQNIEAGQMYYNTTSNILYIYDGSAWFGKLTVAM
jgi:hypothetical protein